MNNKLRAFHARTHVRACVCAYINPLPLRIPARVRNSLQNSRKNGAAAPFHPRNSLQPSACTIIYLGTHGIIRFPAATTKITVQHLHQLILQDGLSVDQNNSTDTPSVFSTPFYNLLSRCTRVNRHSNRVVGGVIITTIIVISVACIASGVQEATMASVSYRFAYIRQRALREYKSISCPAARSTRIYAHIKNM